MADVVPGAQQEFWRPPSVAGATPEADGPSGIVQPFAAACMACGSEFMIGAKFCHSCGVQRPLAAKTASNVQLVADNLLERSLVWTRDTVYWAADSLEKVPFPSWMRYLHFHEIKRGVGLPTAALIAFLTGLGCVAGALAVSLFYKASNLGEFQAIPLWRMEWLLAATASFVAGLLLKKPSE